MFYLNIFVRRVNDYNIFCKKQWIFVNIFGFCNENLKDQQKQYRCQ
jgi:hypothetical protein